MQCDPRVILTENMGGQESKDVNIVQNAAGTAENSLSRGETLSAISVVLLAILVLRIIYRDCRRHHRQKIEKAAEKLQMRNLASGV